MTARCAAELLKPILNWLDFEGNIFEYIPSEMIESTSSLPQEGFPVLSLCATGGFPGFILVSRLEEAQVTQQQFIKFSRKLLSLVYTPGLKDTL